MSRKGFTLIELLIVIAILGLLAALLFPVFVKVRENGRRAACISNLNQIGLAITQYTQDNDDVLPTRRLGITDKTEKESWRTMIYPFVKTVSVFQCPSDPKNGVPDYNTTLPENTEVSGLNTSYAAVRYDGAGLNGTHGAFFDDPKTRKSVPVPLSTLQTPSSTLEVVESTSQFSEFNVTGNGMFDDCKAPQLFGCLFAGHTSRSNCLFADGHVKALQPLQTLDAAEGGTGSINMWTTNNQPFVNASDGPGAVQALTASTQYYAP